MRCTRLAQLWAVRARSAWGMVGQPWLVKSRPCTLWQLNIAIENELHLFFVFFSRVFFPPFLGFDDFHWYLQLSSLICMVFDTFGVWIPQARDILNTRDDENGHEVS